MKIMTGKCYHSLLTEQAVLTLATYFSLIKRYKITQLSPPSPPLPIQLRMRNLILLMCVHMRSFTCGSNPFQVSELLLEERYVHEYKLAEVFLQAAYSGDPSPVVLSMLKSVELQECRAEFQKRGAEFQLLNGASAQQSTGELIRSTMGWSYPHLRDRFVVQLSPAGQ